MKKICLLIFSIVSYSRATNIPFTDTNIRCFGWSVSGTSMTATAFNAPCYFSFLGTALSANMGSSDTMNWKIDSTTYTITGPGIQTIATGLSNSTHTVYMYGNQSTTFINTNNAFQVTGSSTVARVEFGPTYDIGTPPFTTYGKIQGCPQFQSTEGFPNSFLTLYPTELTVDYYATGSYQSFLSINNRIGGLPPIYALYSDGVQISTLSVNTTGGEFQLYTATASDSGQHHYELVQIGLANYTSVPFIMPSGSLSSVSVSTKQCVSIYGDSIVGLSQFSSPPYDGRLGWWLATIATGFSIQREGNSGSKLVPEGQNNTGQITASTPQKSSVMIMEYGVNDAANWANGQSTSTFAVAISTVLTAIANGDSNMQKFLIEEILPTSFVPSGGSGIIPIFRIAQANAVTSYNASTQTVKACFYHTANWIDPATDTIGDGLHPKYANAAITNYPYGNPLQGYGKIDNRLGPILDGYGGAGKSFSVSGPSIGTSGTFTVTRGAQGDWTGDEAIAISDNSGGGTFSASNSSGTNPITITPPSGKTFTFTYTPPGPGTRTISYFSGQDCWTNALDNSFTYPSGVFPRIFSGSARIRGGFTVR